MILYSTLKSLTEEELSILFLITQKFFSWEINYKILTTLRVDIVSKIIDVLKPQALEEKQEIFDKLKEKILSQ